MTDLVGKANDCRYARRRLAGPAPCGPWRLACCLAMLPALLGMAGQALALQVTLNTAVLDGMDASLEFTILDGDLTDNNSVTIAGLMTGGTLHATDCSMSCVGGPPFIISDTGGLGQFLQDLTLGTFITFDITVSTNFAGTGDPDLVSLLLLDLSAHTLVETNLDFPDDALLLIDIAGGARGFNLRLATVTAPVIGVTADGAAPIPEPGTMSLLLLGIPVLLWLRRRRQPRA